MNIEESIDILKEIKELWSSPDPFKDDKDYDRAVAIETLLTAYEKEKEKNKSLEQENSFLKMMYRGTDEFKAIENLAKEE